MIPLSTTALRAAGVPDLDPARAQFAADVHDHLTRSPRELPSRYLYDDLGSALFEAICRLPWYRITRVESGLLATARDDLARRLGRVSTIVELGSGSGDKLRTLLGARTLAAHRPAIHLVDLSRSALDGAQRALAPLAARAVVAHEASYEAGIVEAARAFDASGHALVLFLGSNIGNFDPAAARALLRTVRLELRPGDALLLGADLVKSEPALRLAYDDPLGVTAAFNRNLLVRVNRELGGNFELGRYAHRAVWNQSESRIEMHLVADADQQVRVAAAELEIEIRASESIWTESSYKYRLADIDALLEGGGFEVTRRWTDRPDGFALTLAEAV